VKEQFHECDQGWHGHELATKAIRGYARYPDRVGDTVAILRNIHTWREAEQVDMIGSRRLLHHERFSEIWPSVLCGTDDAGHVVTYESIHDIDVSGLVNFVEQDGVPVNEVAPSSRLFGVRCWSAPLCSNCVALLIFFRTIFIAFFVCFPFLKKKFRRWCCSGCRSTR